jgi:hypothetical protein
VLYNFKQIADEDLPPAPLQQDHRNLPPITSHLIEKIKARWAALTFKNDYIREEIMLWQGGYG